MSMWGAGIKQSDEFMDVYDEFYDRYVDDADPVEIYREILEEYRSEFSSVDMDPIMYTVYYALAQCLWECGQKEPWLWDEIDRIIATEADLAFWSELGMDKRMRESRRKALLKFQEKLRSQPTRIRKPKKSQRRNPQPTLRKGDLFAYACNDGYRAALVLDWCYGWNLFLIGITDPIFDHIPTQDEVMGAVSSTVTWFSPREAIPKKERILLTQLDITADYNNRAGLIYSDTKAGCSAYGKREFFFDPSKAKVTMDRNRVGSYLMKALLVPSVLPFYLQPRFLP